MTETFAAKRATEQETEKPAYEKQEPTLYDFEADAEMLRSNPDRLAFWLTESLQDPDQNGLWADLDFAVKAVGAAKIAKTLGINRGTVHKAFDRDREPSLKLALRIFQAMGMEVIVRPKQPDADSDAA
jgi:DNA-binding phage protein